MREIVAHQTLSMSSKEIADVTQKQHKNVLRDIRAMVSQLYGEPGGSDVSHEQIQGVTFYLDPRGYTTQALLDKDHTLTLLTGYDAKARYKVICRWQELETSASQQVQPVSLEDMPAERLYPPERPSLDDLFTLKFRNSKIRALIDHDFAWFVLDDVLNAIEASEPVLEMVKRLSGLEPECPTCVAYFEPDGESLTLVESSGVLTIVERQNTKLADDFYRSKRGFIRASQGWRVSPQDGCVAQRSRGRQGSSPSVRPVHHSSVASLFCRSTRSLANVFSHVPSDFLPSAFAARSKTARSSGESRKQNFG